MRFMLSIFFAGIVASCSLTIEDREAIRETGFNLATVAVEALQTVGLNPLEDADPKILQYAMVGCTMLAASSPTIVQVINKIVDAHNEALPEMDAQTDRTTVEEFTAGLAAICILVEQLLAPTEVAPMFSPIPEPRPWTFV